MLYNKLTEMCFTQCTDNFNNRLISDAEVIGRTVYGSLAQGVEY